MPEGSRRIRAADFALARPARVTGGLGLAAAGLMLAALSGCSGDSMQRDAQRCAAAGFVPGTTPMAQCMDTAAATRANDDWVGQRRFQQSQDQLRMQQDSIDARNRAQEDAARARVLGQ